LATRVEDWPWSSLQYPELIDSWPGPQPDGLDWFSLRYPKPS
jgi:hypothetical protein